MQHKDAIWCVDIEARFILFLVTETLGLDGGIVVIVEAYIVDLGQIDDFPFSLLLLVLEEQQSTAAI